jgi:hypothetical protein
LETLIELRNSDSGRRELIVAPTVSNVRIGIGSAKTGFCTNAGRIF